VHAKNIVLGLSVVAALALFGVAWQTRLTRLAQAEELTAAKAKSSQLEAELRAQENRAAEAAAARTEALAKLEEARGKAAAIAAATAKAAPTRKAAPALPATVLRDAMLHDPKLQNLQLAVGQAKLTATYQPLCEQLQLTEAQAAQVIAQLRKRGEAEMDLAAVMETQHLAANDPAVTKLRRQAADEFRTAMTTTLGEEGMRQFQAYERTVPVREFVNELAGAMTVSGASLHAAQADALIGLMADASASYRQGGIVTRSNVDWDRVLAGAQSLLSPAQFALLKNGVLQTRNMDKLRELVAKK
jgi:hypothetical protein